MHSHGKIGGGGILRDHQGKLVYAYSIPLGFGTNNTVKIKAALQGISWCKQHGYKRIILKVDLELLCKWINNTSSSPWTSRLDINAIQLVASKLEFFQCRDVFREANGTSNLLSKLSHEQEIIQHFYTQHQHVGLIKGSYIFKSLECKTSEERSLKGLKSHHDEHTIRC